MLPKFTGITRWWQR